MTLKSETPEGKGVGLINNGSIANHISTGDSFYGFIDLIKKAIIPIEKCTVEHLSKWVRVFVNDILFGMIERGLPLGLYKCESIVNITVQRLRKMKNTGGK